MPVRRPLVLVSAALLVVFSLLAFGLRQAYAAIGDLDAGFGAGGKVATAIGGNSGANALVLQPDGKLVAAGFGGNGFAVARYDGAGAIDAGFGTGGSTITVFSGADTAYAAALQSDGKIVLAGRTGDFNFAVARYNSNGTPDAGFGSGGKVVTDFGGSDGAYAVGIQSDGKIVAAGNTDNGGYKVALARYNTNGTPDTSFSGDGKVASLIRDRASAHALKILPGNKILLAASISSDFGIIRYNTDGTLDTTFGGSSSGPGWTRTDFGAGGAASGTALAVQSDGKYLVGGYAVAGTDFALVRYKSNGVIDTTFGGDGRVTTAILNADEISGVVVQPNGKIIVAGSADAGGNADFALARYNSDGTPDAGFGGISVSGVVTTDFGTTFDNASSIVLQSDGNVVVAGQTADTFGAKFALARYVTPMFSDVHPADFFYTPVVYLSSHGIISGYADSTFRPFANTTRGQLSKIIVLAANIPITTPTQPTFTDVSTSNPFYSMIETAVAHNIISGYQVGNTREFRPNANVTRGQLSKIVVNAKQWTLVNPATPTFVDVSASNPFYKEIETAVSHGVISGYDLGGGRREFRWGNNATRGQIAKIVYQATVLQANSGSDKPAADASPSPAPAKDGGSGDKSTAKGK